MDNLPKSVILQILKYLQVKDLNTVSDLNTKWKEVAEIRMSQTSKYKYIRLTKRITFSLLLFLFRNGLLIFRGNFLGGNTIVTFPLGIYVSTYFTLKIEIPPMYPAN